MKNVLVLVCAAAVVSASWAQGKGTPIAISSSQSLAFGGFVAGTGGTVAISAAGVRSQGGGVILVPSGTGSAALFSVTGERRVTYSITLPVNGVVSLTSGANTMAVNNFTSNPVATSASTGFLSSGGSETLSVGATLSVGGNQPSGIYSGSFDVTVDYP